MPLHTLGSPLLVPLPQPLTPPVGASPILVPLPKPLANLANAAAEVSDLPPELLLPEGAMLASASGASSVQVAPRKIQPAGWQIPNAPPAVVASLHKPEAPVPTIPSNHVPQGMCVHDMEVDGRKCTRAEWQIDDLTGKLQACMGRPLVSPAFTACELANLRLIVLPDAREVLKNARSRDRKGMWNDIIKKGPLHGGLKLKADCPEQATGLRFYLTVGSVRVGPLTYDFSEQATHGCNDFGVDWLQHVEKGSGRLSVGIEILNAKSCDDGANFLPPDPVESQGLPRDASSESQDSFDTASGVGRSLRTQGRRAGARRQRRC